MLKVKYMYLLTVDPGVGAIAEKLTTYLNKYCYKLDNDLFVY